MPADSSARDLTRRCILLIFLGTLEALREHISSSEPLSEKGVCFKLSSRDSENSLLSEIRPET